MTPRTSSAVFNIFIGAVAAIALGISALLLYKEISSGVVLPGCGAGSGCGAVLQSGWGHWFFIPVAAFAVGIYILVLGLLANVSFAKVPRQRHVAQAGLLACAVAVLAAALWFIFVQVFIIGAICKYCMSVHGLGIVFGLCVIGRYFHKPEKTTTGHSTFQRIGKKTTFAMVMVGIVGVAVLAAGETLSKAPQARVTRYGNIGINVQLYPIIGSRHAEHILVLFADYTCPFCRKVHRYAEAALKHFGKDQIAFAIAPMPLDAKCNPFVVHTDPIHEGGCELAKIALAVWRINPSKFAQMDHWLFAADHKRSVGAALKKAKQLVGQGAHLEKIMKQKWVHDFILAQTKLNYALGQEAKVGGVPVGDRIPKLILTSSFMEVGAPGSQEDFFKRLEKTLGIHPLEPADDGS